MRSPGAPPLPFSAAAARRRALLGIRRKRPGAPAHKGRGAPYRGVPAPPPPWRLVASARPREVLDRYRVGAVPVTITRDGRYLVDEPPLGGAAAEAYARMFEHMSRSGGDVDFANVTERQILRSLGRSAETLFLEGALASARAAMSYYAVRDTLGYRVIDVSMRDPGVEDITYVGGAAPVSVLHRDHPSMYFMRTNIRFEPRPAGAPPGTYVDHRRSPDALVRTLMRSVGRYATSLSPYVEGSTPARDRLSAFGGTDVTPGGPAFTVRRFPARDVTVADLVAGGALPAEAAAYAWAVLAAGGTGLIVGGTGSGKTTVLNALLSLVSRRWKVVVIEDTEELRPPQECCLRLRTREAAGARSIGMAELLAYTLRQRPQCIVVGEVRLADVPVLFQALEAGHAALATFHAAGPAAAMRRLEARPLEIMAAQQSDLWFVMHVGAVAEGGGSVVRRRMLSLAETRLAGGGGGGAELHTLASYAAASGTYDCAGASAALAGPGGRLAAAAALGPRDAAGDLAERARFLSRLAAEASAGCPRPSAAQIMERASAFDEARAAGRG